MKFSKRISIGDKVIAKNEPVFIIAEAGVNHNGNMSLAKEMVEIAKEAGADAVKFQSFKADFLILNGVEKAPYQKITSDKNETQYDMLKRLEINNNQCAELMRYSQEKGIIFLSTPFEEESLKELNSLEVPAFKIAATDLTNIQYLRKVASLNKPIILSAGMCYLEEIEKALTAIEPLNKNIILLHCTANYPILENEVNLNALNTIQKKFKMMIGYSDHSEGIGAAPYAVALGARVIEKHFTINKNMDGPDHKASVEPTELKALIKEIRRVENYLGSKIKSPTISEQFTRKSLQKCLVAKTEIRVGEQFTEDNVVAKRTNGEGIAAIYIDDVLGEAASKNYTVDDIILRN